ncbi:hypothetical protein L0F63_004849 [Massospora cicadina]|nr:hypothetical protein L0F63_004849 [Massospora cicadina]
MPPSPKKLIPNDLKVVELRKELSARGLPTKGVKRDLVARLESVLSENDTRLEDQEVEGTSPADPPINLVAEHPPTDVQGIPSQPTQLSDSASSPPAKPVPGPVQTTSLDSDRVGSMDEVQLGPETNHTELIQNSQPPPDSQAAKPSMQCAIPESNLLNQGGETHHSLGMGQPPASQTSFQHGVENMPPATLAQQPSANSTIISYPEHSEPAGSTITSHPEHSEPAGSTITSYPERSEPAGVNEALPPVPNDINASLPESATPQNQSGNAPSSESIELAQDTVTEKAPAFSTGDPLPVEDKPTLRPRSPVPDAAATGVVSELAAGDASFAPHPTTLAEDDGIQGQAVAPKLIQPSRVGGSQDPLHPDSSAFISTVPEMVPMDEGALETAAGPSSTLGSQIESSIQHGEGVEGSNGLNPAAETSLTLGSPRGEPCDSPGEKRVETALVAQTHAESANSPHPPDGLPSATPVCEKAEISAAVQVTGPESPPTTEAQPLSPAVHEDAVSFHSSPPAMEQAIALNTEGKALKFVAITNLTRPFPLNDFKEQLREYGPINSFWIDKFRSHCYVHYEDAKGAIQCQSMLAGVQFPPDTGKKLAVVLMEEEAGHLLLQRESASSDRFVLTVEGDTPRLQLYSESCRAPARPLTSLRRPSAKDQELPKPRMPEIPLDKLFCKTSARPPLYYKPRKGLAPRASSAAAGKRSREASVSDDAHSSRSHSDSTRGSPLPKQARLV